MTAPILITSGLSVAYAGGSAGSRPAVDLVSFEIEPGQTLAVIGESGAGKSTLARAIMRLLEKTAKVEGQLLFDGVDLMELTEEAMCSLRGGGIGMIFQDPKASLDPTMKIVNQVAEPLRLHRGLMRAPAKREARRLLEAVGVREEVLEVAPYPHQMSGGLCQRAMIAAALACDPRLLIADEPTSSLDLTLQSQVIDLLMKRQQETGLAIIFISHDLALVSKVADVIAVMYRGAIVEQGAAGEVINNPRHSYTRELVDIWTNGGDAKHDESAGNAPS